MAGLQAACEYIEKEASFISAVENDNIVYFAHCISRTGSYLSGQAHVPEGTAMAYLIAPPVEAIMGLDAAIKAAQVEMKVFYGPPTETNFAGGLLVGSQSACLAACNAFAEAVCKVATRPLDSEERIRGIMGESYEAPRENPGNMGSYEAFGNDDLQATWGNCPIDGSRHCSPWRLPGTSQGKPEEMTELHRGEIVRKDHPGIAFRGKLDALMAEILELQQEARLENAGFQTDIEEIMTFVMKVLEAEVKQEPLGEITILGLNSEEIRQHSHQVEKYYGISHPFPDYRYGRIYVKLNRLRTSVREAEIACCEAFVCPDGSIGRMDILEGINRLSSCVYIMMVRVVAGYYR